MIQNGSDQEKNKNSFRTRFNAIRSFFSENEWVLIGIAWIVTYAICCVGIYKQFKITGDIRSPWDPFYRSFQLFFFDDSMSVSGVIHSWELELGRFLAPAVATYTAFTALFSLFHDQVQTIRLNMMRKHIVVCGLGRKGMGLVHDYREQGFKVVAIEINNENDNIEAARERKAIVIVGDATDSDILKRARVHLADKVVVITGNDGTNVEIAVRTFQLIKDPGEKIHHTVNCYLQVVDSKLRVLFGKHPIFTEIKDPFMISVFNTYSNSARLLFERFPMDRTGITKENPREVHLIIIGFGQMGESILLQAARTGHFANRKKVHATIIDRMAEIKSKIFYGHYPQIEAICSTEFINIEAEDPDLLEKMVHWCDEENKLTTIIIALDNDAHALSCALSFLLKLDYRDIPIIVRMSEEAGLAILLQSEADTSHWMSSIHPFGMTGDICNSRMLSDETLDKYARKIHEDYIAQRLKEDPSSVDPGMLEWEKLSQEMKDSNRQQADHIEIKLRAIGCTISSETEGAPDFSEFTGEETELLACMEHDRWVAERLLTGWTLGPKKPGRKQTPYLVDWVELPEEIREYDREAIRNIPSILAMAQKRITREIR